MLPGLLSACSGADLLNATVPRNTYQGTEGLAYGPHQRQRLDLYRPQAGSATRARQARPLVVFFYGGNWSSGDRADFRFIGEALASQGIVALIADYRLSPAYRYPVFLQDSALAVRWAFDHALEYGADAERIFVMGHSAGAYNAAMLALDARWLAPLGLRPKQLAGWIGLAGPYDFLPILNPLAQVAFDWPATPADSQPLVHASSASPPALLLAARSDSVVNPERNTEALARRLRQSGVRVESELLAGVGHVTLVASMAPVLRSRSPVLERVRMFVGADD
ncbi:MAG: alpha/beta hydrolase [Polaromonas sp.]|nr:alpha/beta hydrolase [Polaromonas sp.]